MPRRTAPPPAPASTPSWPHGPHLPTPHWSGTSPPRPPAACAARAGPGLVRTTAAWSVAVDSPVHRAVRRRPFHPNACGRRSAYPGTSGGLHTAGSLHHRGHSCGASGRTPAATTPSTRGVGHGLRSGMLPLRGRVLMVSGRFLRTGRKAVTAGIALLAAVWAPSSPAVGLAAESGPALAGFLRGTSVNVYAGHERVLAARADALEQHR
ncbi:formate dehydrogenase accessory sulfurtransferase FdhD [Streptomyces cellulosae]